MSIISPFHHSAMIDQFVRLCSVHWASLLWIAIIATLSCFFRWICTPLNRIRRMEDIGYNIPPGLNGRQRATFIRRTQIIRQIGDIPPVFPNGWYCVAESSDVANGRVKAVTIFAQSLALFRSTTGKIHLIDAYCPHMGANMTVGGRVVDGNCIQCPFHGWIFSGSDGKCLKIPYSINRIPDQARVKVWPIIERNLHIYTWFHCDGLLPQWEIPNIAEIENGEWVYKGRIEHEINAHIQETPENAADISHLHFLHRIGITSGSDVTHFDLGQKWPMLRHEWTASWNSLPYPEQHIGVMKLEHKMIIFGWAIPFTYITMEARQLGPAIVHMLFDFGIFGKGITVHHLSPEGPLFQRSRFVMYSTLRTPTLFTRLFLLAEAAHLERDIFIWNNKRYADKPVLCKEDGTILKHRRWFSQFYSDNSPRLLVDGSVSHMEMMPKLDW